MPVAVLQIRIIRGALDKKFQVNFKIVIVISFFYFIFEYTVLFVFFVIMAYVCLLYNNILIHF